MQTLKSEKLSSYKSIQYFISSKPFFLRSPVYTGELKNESEGNIESLSLEYGISKDNIVLLAQAHSNKVVYITGDNISDIQQSDASFTDVPGVMLMILASDCVPLIVYHPEKNIIGVIHAGWKGLQNGIIEQYFQKIQKIFDVRTEDFIVYMGACISGKNYEVGEDLAACFISEYPECLREYVPGDKKYFLDLKGVATKQLLKEGMKPENIEISNSCTYQEEEIFHSYRRHCKTGEAYRGNNALGIYLL